MTNPADNRLAPAPQQSEPPPPGAAEEEGSLLALAALALLVGVVTGLVGAAFRFWLEQADHWRGQFMVWAHGHEMLGLLLVLATCTGVVMAAAWLVRQFAPHAAGSGIPHAEAVLAGEIPQAPFRLIPVKFFGGILAIGSGLALGREGPSVQMGASLAHLVGKIFRCSWPDCRALLAAGAGAGLATAFNAPIAGAIFVLEELVRRFETRIAIAALGASATAIAVARAFLGHEPDFQVPDLPYPAPGTTPLFFVLGALAGLVAIVYNWAILGTSAGLDRFDRWPVEVRAGLIGAAVGLVGWFGPTLVGGGDSLTQQALRGAGDLTIIALVYLLRFALGAVSYAARTPGGLFAPMLVLGAQLGLVFGILCQLAFPMLTIHPAAFALVGMAAFFTGVVRAPVTGMILILEMTATSTLLVPLLGACFTAMVAPTLLGNPPIYESLKERTVRLEMGKQGERQQITNP